MEESSRGRIARLLTIAVVIAGAALRLRQYLFNRSLWYDEALLANIAADSPWTFLFDATSGAPAGFLLPARLAVLAIGHHDWALRLVPLAAGLAAVALAWRIAISTFRTDVARLCAVGLVSFASVFVYYSSEFKPYILDVAVTMAVVACVAEFGRGVSGRALAALGSLALWLSWPSVFVLAGAGSALVLEAAWKRQWQALPALAGIGACWIASFAALWAGTMRSLASNEWIASYWSAGYAPSPFENPSWYCEGALSLVHVAFGPAGPIRVEANPHWFDPSNVALAIVAAAGFLALASISTRLFLLGVGSFAFTLVASALEAYPFRTRLVLFLVPFVYLAIASLMEKVASLRLRSLGAAAVVGTAALLVGQIYVAWPVARSPLNRSDMKGALARVQQQRQSGDRLALSVWSRPAFRFYAGDSGLAEMPVAYEIPAVDGARSFLADLEATPPPSRLWIVFSHRFGERFRFFQEIGSAVTRVSSWEGDGAGAYLVDFPTRNVGAATPGGIGGATADPPREPHTLKSRPRTRSGRYHPQATSIDAP